MRTFREKTCGSGKGWYWEETSESEVSKAHFTKQDNLYELNLCFKEKGSKWEGDFSSEDGMWFEGRVWRTQENTVKIYKASKQPVKKLLVCFSEDGENALLLGQRYDEGQWWWWMLQLEDIEWA